MIALKGRHVLGTEREREVGDYVTTDSVVLSITLVNQRSLGVTKPGGMDKCPRSGGVVRSVARIQQLFGDVMKTSQSMQKIYSDVADLAPKIHIQQVAYENGCKMLLHTAAKSHQDVDNMIEDPCHPIWKDTVAHQNLDTVIGCFYNLFLAALEHFRESLIELKVGLNALRGQGRKNITRRLQSWLARSNSPTFGTTEDLPKLVQNLRNYNDIFCTLIWQAVPRRSGYKLELSLEGDLDCQNVATRASQSHFGCIQRASQVLFHTLSTEWTCRDHAAHSLNVSLSFDYATAGAIVGGKVFRFKVAIICPHSDGSCGLVVDILHDEVCINQTVEEDRSSKKTFIGNRVTGPGAQPKCRDLSDSLAEIDAHQAGGHKIGTFIISESPQRTLPNLGLEEDLCQWLHKSSIAIESKQETRFPYLGFLETESNLRLLFAHVFRDEYQKQGSHSLDDVLLRANHEHRAVPLKDRLRTALFLAAGVLRLSTSLWLRQAWSSKDIHYYDTNDYERCVLEEPFLETNLDIEKARGPLCEVESSAAAMRSCLLSLGLVLIEIAFSAPWRKLQLEEKITGNLLEWERNLLNLMRLNDTVSREIGSRYARVVQICLVQGLEGMETQGPGKAELDEAIFEDIVRELGRCLSAVTFESGV